MGVRKLGCLPSSTLEADDFRCHVAECEGHHITGFRRQHVNQRKVQFADQEEVKNYLEQRFLQRLRGRRTDHFDEADFPACTTQTKSSFTYANSVCRHGDKLPQVRVQDFLSACEFEVHRQKKRRCQKISYLPLCGTECDPEDDCVPCQVAQLKRDLRRRHSSGRRPVCNLCYRYRSQRATMKDIEEAQSKAIPVCKKADLKDKIRGLHTPPPPPVSVMAIPSSPVVTPSPVPVATPDSEYDNSRRDMLIKRYIPQRKLTHYECQPRGRVFFHTDDTANQGIIHQPYSFQRRQATLTKTKRKPKTMTSSTYSVSHLGLMFSLPDHNSDLPERQPCPPVRPWNKGTVLPPINARKVDHVIYDGRDSPPEPVQTRCSSTTCSS